MVEVYVPMSNRQLPSVCDNLWLRSQESMRLNLASSPHGLGARWEIYKSRETLLKGLMYNKSLFTWRRDIYRQERAMGRFLLSWCEL